MEKNRADLPHGVQDARVVAAIIQLVFCRIRSFGLKNWLTYFIIPDSATLLAWLVWKLTGWSLVGWLYTSAEALIVIATVMLMAIVIDRYWEV